MKNDPKYYHKPLTVTRLPLEALDLVRAKSVKDGNQDSYASALRYAVMELAKRLRQEEPAPVRSRPRG